MAQDVMSQILTEDVVIGLRGGDMWRGFEGLREYLSVRAEFFDQRTELKAVLSLTMLSDLDLEITSRLDFFMRRWRPPAANSEEFVGTAFHTWKIRLVDGHFRIASEIVDGFANLNENARRLLSSPVLAGGVEE
ncbi:hypothetical protein [Mycolicibacterium frederiksbergense]|uniref:SnoaL-like domain-containing protein n=1 Tax=Mycolicibacterium frederiksbergense TaxID=117567 RepID=A0A6H0RXP9_9MYCO|nr:hypothetical protein [Mycolicibacterium frederiksbergense]QIV79983.1 hypothetical protein EXE63_02985 [Mycolicibacterium frederiksbergense]